MRRFVFLVTVVVLAAGCGRADPEPDSGPTDKGAEVGTDAVEPDESPEVPGDPAPDVTADPGDENRVTDESVDLPEDVLADLLFDTSEETDSDAPGPDDGDGLTAPDPPADLPGDLQDADAGPDPWDVHGCTQVQGARPYCKVKMSPGTPPKVVKTPADLSAARQECAVYAPGAGPVDLSSEWLVLAYVHNPYHEECRYLNLVFERADVCGVSPHLDASLRFRGYCCDPSDEPGGSPFPAEQYVLVPITPDSQFLVFSPTVFWTDITVGREDPPSVCVDWLGG